MANLMSHMTNGKVQASDPVEKVLYRQMRKITLDTPLSRVSKFLEIDHFLLVVHTQKQCKSISQLLSVQLIDPVL